VSNYKTEIKPIFEENLGKNCLQNIGFQNENLCWVLMVILAAGNIFVKTSFILIYFFITHFYLQISIILFLKGEDFRKKISNMNNHHLTLVCMYLSIFSKF